MKPRHLLGPEEEFLDAAGSFPQEQGESLCPSSAAASQGLLLGAILTLRGPPPGMVGKPFLGPHAGLLRQDEHMLHK